MLFSRVAPGAFAAQRPNLLFIITDQQFADVMSCRMGRQYIHTPAMDGLAARGMLFTRAYSSNPLYIPWRNSVFTTCDNAGTCQFIGTGMRFTCK